MIKNKKLYRILAGIWGTGALLLITLVHLLNIYPGASSVSQEGAEWVIERGAVNPEVITLSQGEADKEVTVQLAEQRFDHLEQTAELTVLLLAFASGLCLYVSGMEFKNSIGNFAVYGTYFLSAAAAASVLYRYAEAYYAALASFETLKSIL